MGLFDDTAGLAEISHTTTCMYFNDVWDRQAKLNDAISNRVVCGSPRAAPGTPEMMPSANTRGDCRGALRAAVAHFGNHTRTGVLDTLPQQGSGVGMDLFDSMTRSKYLSRSAITSMR